MFGIPKQLVPTWASLKDNPLTPQPLVPYILKARTKRENNSALLQFIEHCKEKNIIVWETFHLDTKLCCYIHHGFEQPGREGWATWTSYVFSTFSSSEVKGSLNRSHKANTGWTRVRTSQWMNPLPTRPCFRNFICLSSTKQMHNEFGGTSHVGLSSPSWWAPIT